MLDLGGRDCVQTGVQAICWERGSDKPEAGVGACIHREKRMWGSIRVSVAVPFPLWALEGVSVCSQYQIQAGKKNLGRGWLFELLGHSINGVAVGRALLFLCWTLEVV